MLPRSRNLNFGSRGAKRLGPGRQRVCPERAVLAIVERANRLLVRGAGDAAVALLTRTAARFPDDAAVATRRAYILQLSGQTTAAATEYTRALALDGTRFDAWFGLGCVEFARNAYAGAARCHQCALALRPDHPRTRFELARALFHTGDVDAAIDNLRIVAMDDGLRAEALARIARIIPGSPRADNAAILEARRDWAALETIGQEPARRARDPAQSERRLRIGYVSAFFGARNWMKPVWGVINHHDRSRFEIHLLSERQPPSVASGYHEQGDDRVHDISGMSNDAVAAQIADLGIDILVDLNGYSFQSRFGVFMRRPAPLNIGWFNMYATTGIAAFDYIIADNAVIPYGEEHFYSERVFRVPGSYIAFSVLYPVPEVVAPPSLATGIVTFGAFCPLYKITDQMIAAWAAILRRAPNSRLLLKNAELGDQSNRAALRKRLARHGIQNAQIRLSGPAEHRAFLAAYGDIDIALDSFPYNGGTTTSEALWQGVPVLTFTGDRSVSRMSRSLLLAAGLAAWCTSDLETYIERAVVLAGSSTTPAMLASLRATMRDRLIASDACDSAGLCRALERLYCEAAEQRCSVVALQ
jgi:protein O-GlcNAc transferase